MSLVPDPRVQRTRLHVLTTAREMLVERSGEALTLTRLATKAQVSRRTLYTHWGTIEAVISDAVALQQDSAELDPAGLTARERLRLYLYSVRDRLHEPVTNVAIAALVNQAARDNRSTEPLTVMSEWPISKFHAFVGPISEDDYAILLGPLFLSEFVMRVPASPELMDTLIDVAMIRLALSDNSYGLQPSL